MAFVVFVAFVATLIEKVMVTEFPDGGTGTDFNEVKRSGISFKGSKV